MEESRIHILGVPVDLIDQDTAMKRFEELFPEPGVTTVYTPNSEIIESASLNPELKELIASADLALPDGIGLVYASKLIGHPLKERVTGIDFMESVIAYLEKNGKCII